MPKLAKLMALAIKSETTQGTAVAAAATDFIPLTDKPSWKPVNEKLERHVYREAMGTLPHISGMKSAEIGFRMEMLSTGTTDQAFAPIHTALKACGIAITGGSSAADWTAALASADVSANFLGNATSCSIYYYTDGLLHTIAGAVGTFKAVMEAGKIAYFDFSFKGLYVATSDTVIPTTTYTHTTPPIVESGTLLVDNTAMICQKVEIDLGNKIEMVPDCNSATGVKGFRIVDRNPKASVNPELVTVATYDFWSKYMASTALSASSKGLQIVAGSAVKNKFTFTAPQCQIADVKLGDRGGALTAEVDLVINDSAENDALNIVIDNA